MSDLKRTDLALEQVEEHPGVRQIRRGKAFRITEIELLEDHWDHVIGKPKGRYVTLEAEPLGKFSDAYQERAEELAGELSAFLPEGPVLVAGLGNQEITPDALGPQTAARILATRHLRQELSEEEEFLRSLRQVSVCSCGVMGQTGMEAAEVISAICNSLRPAAVVAVDALACSSLKRLGTTVQICDSGISPGSGVQNSRAALSKETLGIPVIAVGVPTVADLGIIAEELTGRQAQAGMMITPRDIDRLIHQAARLIACSLNLALHPQLEFSEADSITD